MPYALPKGSNETRNDPIAAANFWIGSNKRCVDDSWVGSDSVFFNNFYVSNELGFVAKLCCPQWISVRCWIVLSPANQVSLSNCVVCNESMFAAKLCFLQRIRFCCRIVLSATKKCSLPNCVVYSESVFAIKLWCLQWISPLTILCSSKSVRWQINVTSKLAFSN